MQCSKCHFLNKPSSKFCTECGSLLIEEKSNIPIDLEPVPKQDITIEFPHSESVSFNFAIQEAKKLPNFKKIGEGKSALYRVTLKQTELVYALNLSEALRGWSKKTVYVDGKKINWDTFFSFRWCYGQRKSELYCFGYDNEMQFNLCGCVMSRMFFTEYSEFSTYGKWINNKGDWQFDKIRIKKELEKHLYHVRFCPAINFELIQDVVNALPEIINPFQNKNWQFIEDCYSEFDNCLIIEKNYSGHTKKVAVKGVCAKGKGFIKEIKNRMKLKLPNKL